jgi:ribokinase
VVTTPHLPSPGETVLGSNFRQLPGGKGANQAVAAVRAGASTVFIARVGGDELGAEQRRHLAAEGIDVEHVGVCKHDPTGVALITVASGENGGGAAGASGAGGAAGENSIVVASGANAKIRLEHLADAVKAGALNGAAVLLAQLEIPLSVVVGAFAAARAEGVMTVLNTAPVPHDGLPAELLSLADVVICNRGERDALGSSLDGVTNVITTLGSDGVSFQGRTMPAISVDVVDTTGAGDAFCGAFVAALAHGSGMEEAIVRGNVAGALACTEVGAQSALPSRHRIDELAATTI